MPWSPATGRTWTEIISATPPSSSHEPFRYHCRGSTSAARSVTLGPAVAAPGGLGVGAGGRGAVRAGRGRVRPQAIRGTGQPDGQRGQQGEGAAAATQQRVGGTPAD